MTDNLPELRDIHLPTEGVSFWPPAFGWWILLGLILGIFIGIKLWQWGRQKSAKIYAGHLLQNIAGNTDLEAVSKMSEILRRACVRVYPQAVALSGREWIEFLNEHSKQKLDDNLAELLNNAPFMRNEAMKDKAEQVRQLWNFCRTWIGNNL